MRDKILIYRDYGCSDLNALEYGLKEYFEPRGGTVDFTDAAGIIKEGSLNESVLAFFMPGGAGTPFGGNLRFSAMKKSGNMSVTAAFITAFAPAPIMPAGKPSLRKIFPNCVLSVPAG